MMGKSRRSRSSSRDSRKEKSSKAKKYSSRSRKRSRSRDRNSRRKESKSSRHHKSRKSRYSRSDSQSSSNRSRSSSRRRSISRSKRSRKRSYSRKRSSSLRSSSRRRSTSRSKTKTHRKGSRSRKRSSSPKSPSRVSSNSKPGTRHSSPLLSASDKLKQNVLSIMAKTQVNSAVEDDEAPSIVVLNEINSDSFVQQSFKSSYNKPKSVTVKTQEDPTSNPTLTAMQSSKYRKKKDLPGLAIFSDDLFIDEDEKMKNWLKKLTEYRREFLKLRRPILDET